MNTKIMVTNAILIAIGVLLRIITPLIGVPMQIDFSLIILFIIMIYNNKDYKITLICGIVVGIFAAITTKTPGGQIPNLIDKVITCNLMYIMLRILRERVSNSVKAILIFPIGTIISGAVFLETIALLVGLPGGQSFKILFLSVVVPGAVINTGVGFIFFKVIEKTGKITGIYQAEKGR
ncbi:tryptophan transporter [Clostridium sp. BJN0001]|uniref:tryptophan transporter n=1 Tax=Clostridium sp. BJN0001 TaxID=2930219 RepID=UPI001FD00AFB|nr:tryptophan transporter [Clostridium sp. BJN0001]